jgi:hypothetical protein
MDSLNNWNGWRKISVIIEPPFKCDTVAWGRQYFVSTNGLKMTRGDILVPLMHVHPMIMWVHFHLSKPQPQPVVALPQRKSQFYHSSVFVESSWWGLALAEALRATEEIYCDLFIVQGLPIDREIFRPHSRIIYTALWSQPITTNWKAPSPIEGMLLSFSFFCTYVCQSRPCWSICRNSSFPIC